MVSLALYAVLLAGPAVEDTDTPTAASSTDVSPAEPEGPEPREAGWGDKEKNMTPPDLPGPPARVGPRFTDAYIAAVNRSAERISIGYSVGLWGRGLGEDFRLSFPLGKKKVMGLRTRFIWAHGQFQSREVDEEGRKIAGYDPVIMPTIEFFYRSPVMMGLFRVYGGGGFWVGFRPFPFQADDPATSKFDETAVMNSIPFVGGGHYGIEFFMKPTKAFFIELGGQGPAHALWVDAGASILAGSVWYIGKK